MCGNIGSGKDTVAEGLNHELGYVRLSLALALKEAVHMMFPWVPRCHFFGTQAEKSQLLFVNHEGVEWTGRKLLEVIGDKLRSILSDIWIRAVMEHIDRHPSLATRWVISDVRYPNEFEAIRERDGVVWEVVRTGGPPTERSSHTSDNAWRDVRKDAVLEMPWGHVSDLQRAACELAKR